MARRQPKRDVYQEVTNKILEFLDKGTPPWRQPIVGGGGAGYPTSLATGKRYRGINVFMLALTAWFEGYSSSYWVTFHQAKKLGGSIKKGEKSSLAVFWKWYDKEDKETGQIDRLPVLRHYCLFNADQCEGVKPPDAHEDDGPRSFSPIEACRDIVTGYRDPPVIEHGGKAACYLPREDKIKIADPERFVSGEDYYATLFHECVHSTGHAKRLDRDKDNDAGGHIFGSPEYGREELITEMGAAFLCAHGSISPPTIENSAAYIDGWRKKIQGDNKMVVQAAGKAQAAADYIFGVTFSEPSASV